MLDDKENFTSLATEYCLLFQKISHWVSNIWTREPSQSSYNMVARIFGSCTIIVTGNRGLKSGYCVEDWRTGSERLLLSDFNEC